MIQIKHYDIEQSAYKKQITVYYDNTVTLKASILYFHPDVNTHVPLISFNVKEMYSEEVAEYLNKNFDIYVRAGLHCSPLAHKCYNTTDRGTVRICPSVFTSINDAKAVINAVYMLSKSKKIII